MIQDLKFLVADIDGTLVNEPREMLDLTRKVLQDLHHRGVYLGIASGRPIGPHLLNMAKETWNLGFDMDCFIGMNGGQLYDNIQHTEQSFYQLQPDVIKEILDLMEPIDCNPFIYIGEDMLSEYIDDLMYSSMKRHNINCRTVTSMEEFYKEPTPKLLFRLSDPSYMPKVEAYLADHPSDNFVYFKTQPTMMEVQDPRVNKGIAIEQFCKDNHIALNQVMAFGDMTNDNEMLKIAGWGVCLKNGSDDTKAIADVVTEYTNDEDGFGHYMLDHWYKPNGWVLGD